ncbi:MAG: phosphate transport system substrate-binding protein, partial [Actinomycetota bacterium]|nr:phosphate transport system substrate-binding protein [Actinomycetota bacterium]
PVSPAAAAATINGAGSTWSYIAVNQWQADVARQGIPVNFTANGSTAGRVYYYQDASDFSVSEIPFQAAYRDSTGTVTTNEIALAAHRPYAYLPIVAGGTSFMYHLDVNGSRVTNLRLSPPTLAKIFTGVITAWNDPAITADNGGRQLPPIKIVPVIRSDGSGTSAQFTAFMANQTSTIWTAFCQKVHININPCPATSLYPPFDGSVAQQYSDGVAAFVSSPSNNGAITYVEYGYAKQRGFPVASMLNKAGYYTQPTALNVAVALLQARINPDRTQILTGVYANPDPRTYPVSSYSYMIVPTTTARPFSTDKGSTLGRFILYFLCVGQTKAEQLGYSPLPKNLVQAGFDAEKLIPGAPAPPPIDQCANPTITGAFNLNGPPPPPSDRVGTPVPAGPGQTQTGGPVAAAGNPTGAGNSAGGSKRGSTATTTATTIANGLGGSQGTATGQANPNQLLSASGPVTLPGKQEPLPLGLYILAGAFVLLIVFAPPTVAVAMRSRERGRRSG